MEFKKLVMNDTESKYQDMANGVTKVPFNGTVAVEDYGNYNEKRDGYYSRLDKEKSDFNSAISSINDTKSERIKRENDFDNLLKYEKKAYLPCRITSIIGILLMFFMTFVGLQNDGKMWAEQELIPAIGFEHFFDPDGIGQIPFFVAMGIAVIGTIVVIIVSVVLSVKKGSGRTGYLVIGMLFFSGTIGGVIFLAARLLLVGLGYLLAICINQYFIVICGVVSVIMMLIFGRKQTIKRHRVKLWFNIIIVALLTCCIYYFAHGFDQGKDLGTMIEELISLIEGLVSWVKGIGQ